MPVGEDSDGNQVEITLEKEGILIVITGMFTGMKIDETIIRCDHIKDADFEKGLLKGKLMIYTLDDEIKINKVNNNEADSFVRLLKDRMNRIKTFPDYADSDENVNLLAELKRAKELLDKGKITPDEFQRILDKCL